jgi:hypothetical protein
MSGLPKAEIRMLFMSKRPRSSRTDRGAQVVPPAGATVRPWLPAKSARVSNLRACCALGPPAWPGGRPSPPKTTRVVPATISCIGRMRAIIGSAVLRATVTIAASPVLRSRRIGSTRKVVCSQMPVRTRGSASSMITAVTPPMKRESGFLNTRQETRGARRICAGGCGPR